MKSKRGLVLWYFISPNSPSASIVPSSVVKNSSLFPTCPACGIRAIPCESVAKNLFSSLRLNAFVFLTLSTQSSQTPRAPSRLCAPAPLPPAAIPCPPPDASCHFPIPQPKPHGCSRSLFPWRLPPCTPRIIASRLIASRGLISTGPRLPMIDTRPPFASNVRSLPRFVCAAISRITSTPRPPVSSTICFK